MSKRLSTQELVAEVAWLTDANTSAPIVCDMLGMTPNAIGSRLRAAGRQDLATPFWVERKLRAGK